jgi:hypothetical protein
MKKPFVIIPAIILIILGLLVFIFIKIGGKFDILFWLNFLPGLLSNLIILLVALFIIDRIFQRERLTKLKQINAENSKWVLFENNRIAFLLLEYLGLAKSEELSKDKELNFEFAIERIKRNGLSEVFFKKFMDAKDRGNFLDGFIDKLKDGTEQINKSLDKIFPHPDPFIKGLLSNMAFLSGGIQSMKIILDATSKANKKVKSDQRISPEQINLLIKIAYSEGRLFKQIFKNLIIISEKAKSNELFVSLD